MKKWIYSLLILLPIAAFADSNSFMNKTHNFWGGWMAGEVTLYWSDFPEETTAFSLQKRADNDKKWSKLTELPLEAAFSPQRPYLDSPESTQHGIHYRLEALDKNRKAIKKYDELYIAACTDDESSPCQKEVH